MRKLFVLIHRYVGLAMTVFLIIVGLTGSVLAFYHELDRWLNPELLTVTVRDGPMLDHFTLGQRAEALEPRARIDYVRLARKPGESYTVWLSAKTDPATGKTYVLPYNELLLDPYTGEKIGARKSGEVSLAKEDILSFLYRLHMTLALPETMGSLGGYILGITALVWTLDCFVGFYLTLPPGTRRRRSFFRFLPPGRGRMGVEGLGRARSSTLDPHLNPPPSRGRRRGFWPRWKPAWLIKRSRFNYDLHRASGLWVWAMLLVLGWSSVALNLREVYRPVMQTFFTMAEELPALDAPLEAPSLGWREAIAHSSCKRRGRDRLRALQPVDRLARAPARAFVANASRLRLRRAQRRRCASLVFLDLDLDDASRRPMDIPHLPRRARGRQDGL